MSSILVVDDDSQVLEVVGEMLRLEGYDVATAVDGRDAVNQFKRAEFDLVITDLIMPEKEGLETIAELRNLRGKVPVIAMSGGGRIGPTDYLETARFIGANATLAKPFARSELISLVSNLLSDARPAV
ncbi:MAG: response regulator [Gammaproteobacteria bacterium]|nr:response regulator [Gammaproteobacteria bacterium]